MERFTIRLVQPKVRSTLATLAVLVLVLVTAIPAEAAGGDGDRASVAAGTAIPHPVIVVTPGADSPEPQSGTADRSKSGNAQAPPTAGRLRGDGTAWHAEAIAARGIDAIAPALAGERGTALPGDDVVAASERPRSSSGAPSGDRTSGEPQHARSDALPDPGSLQVFGLGLVIIATVAGTWRRRTDMSF